MSATLNDVRLKGLKILSEKLDPVEMIQFFQVYENGIGDYTNERKKKYKNIKLEDIRSGISLMKNKKKKVKADQPLTMTNSGDNIKFPVGEFIHPEKTTDEHISVWIEEIEKFPSVLRETITNWSDEQLSTRTKPGDRKSTRLNSSH